MTKAKTFVLLLAVVGLCAGSALGQATKTTIFQVDYGLGPTANDLSSPKDNSIIATPEEGHCNRGGYSSNRILKQYQHTYIADWDTAPMMTDVDVAGQLTGWGSYTPNYYLAIQPRTSTSVHMNDNGTPEDPSDDYPDYYEPLSTTDWPAPGSALPVHISSIWSTNDWYEGDGASFAEYNWSNVMGTWASTVYYAGDHPIGGQIPWSFPGGGTGANAPYDPFPDCTLGETFHTRADFRGYDDPLLGDWSPWNGEAKTPTNSTSFLFDNSTFSLVDVNATPEDPWDDLWLSPYVEVQLDQAMMDDMFNNENNRGIALWDQWAWVGPNGPMYSADQNSSYWPYIYARIEACSGDANLDQAVDGLDYVSWSNNYQVAAMGWAGGDFNNDGVTDGLDYVIWSNNYQQSCPGVPGAVPEPATMALLAIGGLALLKRRR